MLIFIVNCWTKLFFGIVLAYATIPAFLSRRIWPDTWPKLIGQILFVALVYAVAAGLTFVGRRLVSVRPSIPHRSTDFIAGLFFVLGIDYFAGMPKFEAALVELMRTSDRFKPTASELFWMHGFLFGPASMLWGIACFGIALLALTLDRRNKPEMNMLFGIVLAVLLICTASAMIHPSLA